MHQRGKSRWAAAGLAVDRTGRPSALLAESRWAPVDPRVDRPLKRKHSFLRAVDPAVDPENPRADTVSRSTRAVDRRTCTECARPVQVPVDRAGWPGLPETEKQQNFELGKFCKKYFEVRKNR